MAKKKAVSKYVEVAGEDKLIKLSKGEQRLLSVLREKKSLTLTVEEICKDSNITLSTYYRAFRDEEFNKVVKQECHGLLNALKLPLTHRIAQEAINNPHHSWAKMAAEMAEIYTPGGKQNTKPVVINFIVQGVERPKIEAEVIEVS